MLKLTLLPYSDYDAYPKLGLYSGFYNKLKILNFNPYFLNFFLKLFTG